MKKNSYIDMIARHQKEVNEFPFMFAFSEKQFKEGMEKLGLKECDTDKISSIGAGGFVRDSDIDKMKKMFNNQRKELWDSIEADKTGEGFILEMFSYELSNHEYIITRDVEDTLNALEIKEQHFRENPILLRGLKLACKKELNEEYIPESEMEI